MLNKIQFGLIQDGVSLSNTEWNKLFRTEARPIRIPVPEGTVGAMSDKVDGKRVFYTLITPNRKYRRALSRERSDSRKRWIVTRLMHILKGEWKQRVKESLIAMR